MKTLTKKQFDDILLNKENKVLSNKSSYKKDENKQKFHQTVIKYKTASGETITAVREIDVKGPQYYTL